MLKTKINKSLILNILYIALYCVITLFVVLHHEIWADEAQAWLVVRDLDIFGVIKHVRTEGHPLLWYMVLLPFAQLKFSVFSMQILNWIFMILAAGIFVFKSPFHKITNLCIIFSSAFLYWYPVVARSYGLMILLFVLSIVLYEKQKDKPYLFAICVALLAHTHVIAFGFCAALAGVFFFKNILFEKDKSLKKKYICPFLIMLFSLTAVVLYLNGSQNENFIVKGYDIKNNAVLLKGLYFDIVKNLYGFENWFFALFLGLFFVFNTIYLFIKNKSLFFIFAFNFAYILSVFIFIWGMMQQRTFLLMLVPLFCLFVLYGTQDRRNKIIINTILSCAFLFTLPNAFEIIKNDINHPFSDSKNIAQYIQKNLDKNAVIVTNSPISTASILSYLPEDGQKIFYIPYNGYFTYYDWKKPVLSPYYPIPVEEILKQVPEVYVLTAVYLSYNNIKPLYESDLKTVMHSEIFRIYKFERKNNGK